MALAWAVRNWRQVGADRRGEGSMPESGISCHSYQTARHWPSRTSTPTNSRCKQVRRSLAMPTTAVVIADPVGAGPDRRREVYTQLREPRPRSRATSEPELTRNSYEQRQ